MRAHQISLTIGTTLLLLSIGGAWVNARTFFQSYLFSFLFWSDLPLGAIPLMMIYHLTGGSWGAASRRILEALSDTVWIIALFSIPLLGGLHQIYPWLDPTLISDPRIEHKQAYLNPIFFSVRTIVYFISWIWMNRFLQKHSRVQENSENLESQNQLQSLSARGLVLATLASTFASIDWQMSVEPKWYSTIYGMIYGIAQSLSSFSFALLVFALAARKETLNSQFSKKTLRDLGNILLTLVMVWTYLAFMQYLIIWSGNLPHEVTWFISRTRGGWQWLALILFLFQFLVPFCFLLFRESKDHVYRLGYLGGLIFLIRIIDHYWMLIPGFQPEHFDLSWQVITTWFGIGGVWLSVFLNRLQRSPVLLDPVGEGLL